MKWRYLALAGLAAQLPASFAGAQPSDMPIPAANSTELPAGISVVKSKASKTGFIYVDSKGHTLYGLDRRAVAGRTGNPWTYCDKECAKTWLPFLAAADAKPVGAAPADGGGGGARPGGPGGQLPPGVSLPPGVNPAALAAAQGGGQRPPGAGGGGGGLFGRGGGPDWSIADTPHGRQWVYKGSHLVFTHAGDKPGSTALDGADEFTWNVLKYVPPVPKIVAPTNVSTSYVGDAYALADKDGRLLYTSGKPADCAAGCVPFAAGYASRGVGEWTVSRSTDSPQWLYRGKPVYITREVDATGQSAKGPLLRP